MKKSSSQEKGPSINIHAVESILTSIKYETPEIIKKFLPVMMKSSLKTATKNIRKQMIPLQLSSGGRHSFV